MLSYFLTFVFFVDYRFYIYQRVWTPWGGGSGGGAAAAERLIFVIERILRPAIGFYPFR